MTIYEEEADANEIENVITMLKRALVAMGDHVPGPSKMVSDAIERLDSANAEYAYLLGELEKVEALNPDKGGGGFRERLAFRDACIRNARGAIDEASKSIIEALESIESISSSLAGKL